MSEKEYTSSVFSVMLGHLDPHSWSILRRWAIALTIGCLIAPIDMFSTIYYGAQPQIEHQFHTSQFVATLGVGLVNLGIAVGPLFAAPLSELYGRQPMYIFSAVSFTCFACGSALSRNIASLLICRFLAALCGSSVFSNFGGSLSDMFTPEERAPLVALFSLVLQGAPTLGPVPGAFLGEYTSWRWIFGLSAIWAGVITIPVLFLPETEIGAITVRARRKLEGKPWRPFVSNITNSTSRKEFWRKALLTPLIMLFFEPIILATSLYHAFVYSLLFILLEAYPYVFSTTYNFTLSQSGLVFVSPALGNALGVILYFGYFKPSYEKQTRALRESNLKALKTDPHAYRECFTTLKPETRLPGILVSALLVPCGMFWFAATCSSAKIHWIVPILSGLPIGAGLTLLQLSLSNYYIDLYPKLSASALAANLLIRNFLAAWFPTFAIPMYKALGMREAGMLLAGVSLLGVPGGWVLWVYGWRLRKRSAWAVQDDDLRIGDVPAIGPGEKSGSLQHKISDTTIAVSDVDDEKMAAL